MTRFLPFLTICFLLLPGAACTPTTGDDVTVIGADQLRTPIPRQTVTPAPTALPREAFDRIQPDTLEHLALVREQPAHAGAIYAVRFSDAGSLLYSVGEDGVLRRWRMADGALAAEFQLFQTDSSAAAFLGDELALVAGDVAQVVLFDLVTGTEVLRFAAPEAVTSVNFLPKTDPTAPQFALGYESGRAQVFATGDAGSPPATLLDVQFRRGDTAVLGLDFSADGQTLITAHRGSNILLWDATSGERLNRLTRHGGDVLSVQRLPDGGGFASTSADNSIRFFALDTAEQTQVFRGHQFNVAQVAFNATATLMASTGQDATVRVWNPANARELFTLDLRPGSGGIIWTRGVAFSPDNIWLAVGSDDGTLKYLAVLTEEVRAEAAG
jgi:WD40 repeat protein